MAVGDVVDIGGRAFVEVEPAGRGEQAARTYAPVMGIASIGKASDAPWDGTSADATVISLLKRIALNTQ